MCLFIYLSTYLSIYLICLIYLFYVFIYTLICPLQYGMSVVSAGGKAFELFLFCTKGLDTYRVVMEIDTGT